MYPIADLEKKASQNLRLVIKYKFGTREQFRKWPPLCKKFERPVDEGVPQTTLSRWLKGDFRLNNAYNVAECLGINKNDFVNPDKDIENVIFELDIDNPVNAFLDCINQLKPPQKKIFILLELEKCSIDEIYQNYNVAEMIGKSSVSFESFEKYCKNIYQQLNDCIRGI